MSKVYGKTLLEDMVRSQSLPMPLVKQAATEILGVIRDGLRKDGVVKVSNFGTFRLKPVAARRGFNPRTGETITIPAQKRVIFTPCKALRDLIQPIYQPPEPVVPKPPSPASSLSDTTDTTATPKHPVRDKAGERPPSMAKQSGEIHAAASLTTHYVSQPHQPPVSETPLEAADQPHIPFAETHAPLSVTERNENEQALRPRDPSPGLHGKHTAAKFAEPDSFSPQQDGKGNTGTSNVDPLASLPPGTDESRESRSKTVATPPLEVEERSEAGAADITRQQQPEKKEESTSDNEAVPATRHEGVVSQIQQRSENQIHNAESESVREMEFKIPDKPSHSNKKYILGIAAVVLITLIGTGLVIELNTGSDDTPSTSATIASSIEDKVPEPAITLSTIPDELPASEGIATNETSMSNAEIMVGDGDSPHADTEADNPEPVSEKELVASETPAESQENIVEATSSTDSAAVTGAESPVVTHAQEYFFTEQPHQVGKGESLWRLARSHYRDPLLWPHIYQANISTIDDPDYLLVGSTITIPGLQGSPAHLSKTDRRNIAEGYYLAYLHYKKIGRKDALFALLEAKRYDNSVVEEHRNLMQLSKVEELKLAQQQTMPF